MSSSQGEKGGLPEAASNDITQELFDSPSQTAATSKTPEEQVRVCVGMNVVGVFFLTITFTHICVSVTRTVQRTG